MSTYTEDSQTDPSVALDASGNFVVVWTSGFGSDQDGSEDGVFGQRFDSSGSPLGGEFQVNTYTTGDQNDPSVAWDAAGNFVVVWESHGQDGGLGGVFGRRYDGSGNPLGDEFQVNTFTTSWQMGPSVAADAKGEFVVVWASGNQDGSYYGVFGQRYDRAGERIGSEFQVNTYTDDLQGDPYVASDASGNFVVVWYGNGDGDTTGIFGQRFAPGCEASVQVHGEAHTPGGLIPVQVHIAHRRPKTVTVAWELSLIDASVLSQRFA